MNNVSVLLQAEGLAATLVLLVLVFLVAAVVAFILVAVWLYNDCRQRGENVALWLTLYIIVGIVTGIIGAVIVLVIYLVSRSKEIKYDRQGNLIVPSAPPTPMYYGQPPRTGWQQPNEPPITYNAPTPSPMGGAPVAMYATPSPAPQTLAPPTLSKVRCPRCRTVFEYQRQPVGQTHVKCPACGEEGNI